MKSIAKLYKHNIKVKLLMLYPSKKNPKCSK